MRHRSLLALACGALAGGLLATSVVARERTAERHRLDAEAIATVDGRAILRVEFERALAMLAADADEAPSETDRARVLERVIDEEILVQNAVDAGLLASDRSLREVVTGALLASMAADADAATALSNYLAELRAGADIVVLAESE